MSFVTSYEMLLDAQKNNYAVGAFNVENMEMIKAVLAAAEEMRSPVILQTTPSTLKYAAPELFAAMVKAEAANVTVPVCLHLDHGNSIDLAIRAIAAGYSSVMIDGSALAFAENIALSASVVEKAHAAGIPVEAELGTVGGKEDSLVRNGSIYTDPDDAVKFVAETGVDSLAVAIGTAHGIYKTTPKIDIARLSAIRDKVSVPLVLHGTSGVPEDVVAECVRRGICKVNYATDLRVAYTAGVREYLAANSDAYDPKKYGIEGMKRVTAHVESKMKPLGSCGKA